MMPPQQQLQQLPTGFDFYRFGMAIAGFKATDNARIKNRRFKAHFGYDPYLCEITWARLVGSGWTRKVRSPNPHHLLWALMFNKAYRTEEENAAKCDCDEKTFRKWCWFYLEGLARLDKSVVRILFHRLLPQCQRQASLSSQHVICPCGSCTHLVGVLGLVLSLVTHSFGCRWSHYCFLLLLPTFVLDWLVVRWRVVVRSVGAIDIEGTSSSNVLLQLMALTIAFVNQSPFLEAGMAISFMVRV